MKSIISYYKFLKEDKGGLGSVQTAQYRKSTRILISAAKVTASEEGELLPQN